LALARLHQRGFEHGDLYSKHILVSPAPAPTFLTFRFLDWQRARHHRSFGWPARWRDLATLDATLADSLASARERLLVLRTYLKQSRTAPEHPFGLTLGSAAWEVRRRALKLLQRRRIREMREPPLGSGAQNLIWADGETLLITREFRDELKGKVPEWLRELVQAKGQADLKQAGERLQPAFRGQVQTRWVSWPWRWLWAWFRRRPLVAPALESMNVLFRLERYGVVMPRLLAAGQKSARPWQMQSFLLTEPLAGAVALLPYLASVPALERRIVLRRTGHVLNQMHRANCYVDAVRQPSIGRLFAVCNRGGTGPTVALATVEGIYKSHYANPIRAQRDVASLLQALNGNCSTTDVVRLLLAYVGQKHLTRAGKQWVRRVLNRLAPAAGQRSAA
jgi:hypothetical protein